MPRDDKHDLNIDDLETDGESVKGGGRRPGNNIGRRLDKPREVKHGASLSGGLRGIGDDPLEPQAD